MVSCKPTVGLTVAGSAVTPGQSVSGCLEEVTDSRQAARRAVGAQYRGLYVHVPFCRHKCHYCDFYSFVDTQGRSEAFVERLEAEAAFAREYVTSPLETVFVGGGTPTMLPASLLQRMLTSLRHHLPIVPDAQWTVEANPETVDVDIAKALIDSGVRRVSLGAQSFNPALLKALERNHNPDSVRRAVETLRSAGIAEINLDLIFAIPGSRLDDWRRDLELTAALNPQHISAYGLVYEPNTALTVKLRKGLVQRLPEDEEAQQYEFTVDALGQLGYERYEISNWCKPGHECRHNIVYWENADWWALGPSASAHGAGVRWRNVPRLASWLESGPASPIEGFEALGDDAVVGESFMLGLRLIQGIELSRVESLLGRGSRASQRREAIEKFVQDGLLIRTEGRLRLSSRGLAIADTVLCALI